MVVCDVIVTERKTGLYRSVELHQALSRSCLKPCGWNRVLVKVCFVNDFDWSRLPELNRRPSNYESDALPTELSRLRREADAETQLQYTNAEFAVSSRTDRTNRRDSMPKDPTKNIDSYKIRGGVINEYEYRQNQEALAQHEAKGDGRLIPGMPPEEGPQKSTKGPQKSTELKTPAKKSAAKRAAPNKAATKKAAAKRPAPKKSLAKKTAAKSATKKSAKSSKSTTAAGTAKKSSKKTGASAKKLAARKAAKK